MNNIILSTDSYKIGSHWNMYPAGTTNVYSYFEARQGGVYPYAVAFGLQYYLKEYLSGHVVTQAKISKAAKLCRAHFGNDTAFNKAGWEYILRKHEGKLPLRIKSIPEGTVVPEGNVLLTVENTDDKCPWLTNYVESILSHLWYPYTVATISHITKTLIKKYLEETASNNNALDFLLHDFGYRSGTSEESASIGGAAHLINFKGTDTPPAIEFLSNYYNDNSFDGIGFSVPASEHSIATSLGKDGEVAITRQLLQKYSKGILSVVSDSYDIYYFVSNILGVLLKDEILARDGVFVVRPDSVTPLHPTPEQEMIWILSALWEKFGGTTNSKGYQVLHPKIRVLWGDGINTQGIDKILFLMKENKFSAENIATFGMGSGLIQKNVHRDLLRFAFKSSWQKRDGVGYDIYKEPKDLSKVSKKGRLSLVRHEGAHGTILTTVPETTADRDVLQTVFLNGKVMKHYGLTEIRKNAQTVWPPYS